MTNKKPWWKKPFKNDKNEITDDYRFKEELKKKRLKERTFGNKPDDWEVNRRRPMLNENDLGSFLNRVPFSFGPKDGFLTDIEHEFSEMQENMDRMFRQVADGKINHSPGEGRSFMYGYSMHTGPDGKPQVKEWGNMPPEMMDRFRDRREGMLPFRVERDDIDSLDRSCESGSCNTCGPSTTSEFTNTRKPVADVLECGDHISVTMELPGVERDNINLEIVDNALVITVDSPVKKYFDTIRLPAEVEPNSMEATFKNGVLNIRLNTLSK